MSQTCLKNVKKEEKGSMQRALLRGQTVFFFFVILQFRVVVEGVGRREAHPPQRQGARGHAVCSCHG